MRLTLILILAATLKFGAGPALAQDDAGVSVHDQRLVIQVAGRTFNLAARVFRPAGAGPFPLVVINHGTPVKAEDAVNERLGYAKGARWFAAHGFVVVVALRPGFGSSDGPYLEGAGPCDDRDYVRGGRATGEIERAIVVSAARLPQVDPARIVVVGQSAGGFGVIAMADAPPPGVLGVISFAGGRGGDDHEHICSGVARLVEAAKVFGAANRVPQLWLYAANDHFFNPQVAHELYGAYSAGSRPAVRFVGLPTFDGDGHRTFAEADPSVWAPAVAQFLAQVAAPGV
jgi:dienelactone hydrolase